LALPREAEPEAAIVVLFLSEIDAANELAGIGFYAESPVPGFAALDCWERHVANEPVSGIGGIGPGNLSREMAHDFPMGKEELDLRGIGKFQRAQEQARRF
jgi:hypothetical protein